MINKSGIIKESFTEVIPTLKKADLFSVFERHVFDRKRVPYNRRDFYKIAVTSGTDTLNYADKTVEVDQPALIFSNPMIPYGWEAKSADQEGFFCLFTEEFLAFKDHRQLLKDFPVFSVGMGPVYFLDKMQLDYISSIFRNMLREYNSDYSHKYDLLHSHVNLIFHEAMKMKPAVEYIKHNASERIATLFMALMERQFPVDSLKAILKLKTANDYAKQLSVHVNHLNRAVKEVTGKTTTEHLNERLINEAKLLLQHTNWTINEIAYSLGYEYPTYFTNFFKKQTGISPNAVR
ncbi:Helix-turn-helix domain-containing protein [Mucilaginibacter lappiensis]|uniref:AraC-like DNA-binding protein n=1 Tax=Mucilaginibacter lappiensis TaxID=354630 RepID=A0ABR6PD26_9SPHI|nr:AraC family transcriptional regulator [Mucilaginibacter lappiensis]MBB6107660.1 AraC-like DNA-binding protein [Mucilaginibacter lappiensis]SIQ01337.1 Helix-turn-helix domain-containing protein [Mucilaginibacter lappiensis]